MVSKRQRKLLSLILSILVGLNLMFTGLTSVTAEGAKTFDLVEVTDFHGQLLDSSGTNYVGAALSKAVKDIKASNPDTLILGGGDLYQGTPLSNVLHGAPVRDVFTDMGMNYTALGNHEFDWGLNTIINETMTGAGYRILCANVYDKTTGQRVFEPYAITTIDGVRIAVIGAIKSDAPTIILPANVADYNFTDVATEINACAQEIKTGDLADVILAVIHEGGNELKTIVNNMHGVDAVFGGHSHSTLDTTYTDADGKTVPTFNANASGKGYIDVKMTVDTGSDTISFSSSGNYHGITVNSSTPLDPTAKSIIDEANADLAPIFNEVIGTIPSALTKDQVGQPYGESQLGNWMSDVIKNYARADVGMQNNGGIRLSPVAAGNITVGTVFNLMPFDNTVCSVDLTGAQLKALLNQAVKDGGKGIQLSGIKFNYDPSKSSGDRVTKIVRESDGTTVQDTDVLKVAAPDFLETGGDGFTVFLEGTNFNNSYQLIRDALVADVRAKGTITAVMPGRIINDASSGTATPMTISQARAAASGNAILTGVVTTVSGSNVFMQDDTAGICFYNSAHASVQKGDQIKVTGVLSIYNNLTEITPKSASDVQVLSSNNPVTPKVVTISQINESLEGQLIKVQGVTLNNIDTGGSSMIQDSTGSIAIYKIPALTGISEGDRVDVTGAVGQYSTSYEVFVGNAADVVKVGGGESPATKITVLATSDMHGNIYNWDYAGGKVPTSSTAIGLATVSTFVKGVRANNPNVILVDNGDTIQGTPLSYYYDMIDKTSEYPMMKVMGAMGYDSWTLGNHEYNYGLETLNRIIGDATDEGIDVLSANTYKTADGSNFVKPYITRSFNVNGKTIKVGILGLTTKTIPSWEDAAHYAGLQFNDLVSEASKWVPILRTTENCDVVIVVAHSGEEGSSDVIPENQIKAIATGVNGIDAIVAGHAHSTLNDLNLKSPDGKTVPVLEPSKYGNYVSEIDINVDGTGNITGLATKNVKMDPAVYPEDTAITTLVQSYQDKTLEYIQTVLGTSTGEFKGAGQYVVPTAIMDLVNKVQKDAAGTQLSIAAPLSASAYVPQGDITIKDIMGVYVYENFLYGVKMTGAQLKNWMEYSVRYYKQVNDPNLVIDANTNYRDLKDTGLNIADYNLDQLYGATYDVDLTQPACTLDANGKVVSGNRIKNLKVNGVLVKDSDVFTVAINNYRYNGGGGFMNAIGLSNSTADYPNVVMYDSAKVLGDDGQVRSLMMNYIKNNGTITPTNSNSWKLYAVHVTQESEPQEEPIDETPYTGPTTTQPTTTPTSNIHDGIAVIPATVDSNGNAAAAVTTAQVTDLLKSMGGKTPEIEVNVDPAAKEVDVAIPKDALKAINDSSANEVVIDAGIGEVSFDKTAIAAINSSNADISLSVAKVDRASLPTAVQNSIGNHPVFDFAISAGNTTISNFNGGNVTIVLPYIPAAGEDPNAIVIYYIDSNGQLSTVNLSEANISDGKVSFVTTHFSKYAVGYNKVNFTDTADNWSKDNITYLAARNIVGGVGNDTFAPDKIITRAEFAKILAGIVGVDVSGYTVSKFSDVPADAWYAPYVAWAAEKGITKGSGDGSFNPNAPISREEMAVMITRFADIAKYKLPSSVTPLSFADSGSISSWAVNAVSAVQAAGIISGKPNNVFDPKAGATRAEAAKMLTILIKGMVE